MAPVCSAFPRMQFYDGKGLKDSKKVLEDKAVRKAVREISLSLGVTGPKNEGSEYFVTDVVYGCSRVELNGTSLVNHANADVNINLVNRLLESEAVAAGMIQILTYYQGQRRLIMEKMNLQPWSEETRNAIEISTVDSYQGRESEVVIFDTVAAKDRLRDKGEVPDDAEDLEDLGTEDFIKPGTLTAHVTNPNRLNVALTRGKDATIVICQAGLLAGSFRQKEGKRTNAMANCLATDHTEDTNVDSVKARADKGEAKFTPERQERRQEDLGFIAAGKIRWSAIKWLYHISQYEAPRHYRVQGKHTTRPIGNPELAAKADAHDDLILAGKRSQDTEATRKGNERTLQLGLQQSLASTGDPNTPEAPSTIDVDKEDQDAANSDGYASMPEDDDEEEEEIVVAEGQEFIDIDPSNESDRFATSLVLT